MTRTSTRISTYLESEIARGAFPGAQYVIGEAGHIVFEAALGHAVVEPERIAATLDTIYDLASLTKPLVTALLAVILDERGLWDLRAPAADYLSELRQCKRRVTLTELLTHTSGLPNWRPLYLETAQPAAVPAYIAGLIDEVSGATMLPVVYSDLNYILLGAALERITGMKLDRLARQEIIEPLALTRTAFNPPPEWKREIAATELGQSFEHANAACDAENRGRADAEKDDAGTGGRGDAEKEEANDQRTIIPASPRPPVPASPIRVPASYLWREGVIWGEVHDGNAHYFGGVAGHAGLFSTAREVFQIASQSLRGSRLVSERGLNWLTENLTPGRLTARSIGWVLAATADCSAGAALPPTAIGHNGFTGTSVWMDAEAQRVFVLLTNRVHPHIGPIDMKGVRQRFNTLAVEALG
ncbi:MAG TPA: serine hydrolase domain-containing protein [Blastocatellia bacterium]|nr:serine hydrolase domain-containing protein [Blastocatellia bacterium]